MQTQQNHDKEFHFVAILIQITILEIIMRFYIDKCISFWLFSHLFDSFTHANHQLRCDIPRRSTTAAHFEIKEKKTRN